MEVADDYMREESIPMEVGIAREIVVDYLDLPFMTRAQHRAEALLLEYSYRTDY
jgi:hypothetical protein